MRVCYDCSYHAEPSQVLMMLILHVSTSCLKSNRSGYMPVCSHSAMHVGLGTPAEVDVTCPAGTTAAFAIRSGSPSTCATKTTISQPCRTHTMYPSTVPLLQLTYYCLGARHIHFALTGSVIWPFLDRGPSSASIDAACQDSHGSHNFYCNYTDPVARRKSSWRIHRHNCQNAVVTARTPEQVS